MKRLVSVLFLWASAALADDNRAGEFDYYVLSLSWSPTWCAIEGDARDADQCRRGGGAGWMLHGLWPQYERGWPSHCHSARTPPSRATTAAMADVMGSPGLAWYQWKKHGTCSGLSGADYFALARHAYDSVNRPDVFRKLQDPVRLPATVVEEAFLKANPGWTADMLTVTCREGRIQEARLCLTRGLEPVPCAPDTARDCRLPDALFAPIR